MKCSDITYLFQGKSDELTSICSPLRALEAAKKPKVRAKCSDLIFIDRHCLKVVPWTINGINLYFRLRGNALNKDPK